VRISKITLGTVNFGQDYGLREKQRNKVSKKIAIKIIRKAFKSGINSFDTSPDYGNAEKILGEALKKCNCLIATKIYIQSKKKIDLKKILKSINKSRKNLNKKKLDSIQIHNADENIFKNSELKNFFLNLKKKKLIKIIGATVYTQREALACINSGWIESIQVPYNIINQEMNIKVFNLAKKNKIKIFTRSTFLKGVLTEKISFLPKQMEALKKEIKKNLSKLNLDLKDLKQLALKFVTSNMQIDSIVLGIDNFEQLNEIIKFKKKKFSNSYLKRLSIFDSKSKLKDPRLWPFV
tara:strand:- start:11 stop:892 length:882 start_codon:yes stop_codon:yes gene_type:complete